MSAAPSSWQLPAYAYDTTTFAKASAQQIPNPPGYAPLASTGSSSRRGTGKSAVATTTASTKTPAEVEKSKRSLDALRAQRAWDLAIGPAKSVPMQGFMMYMSGGGLQIFSLMIVFQLIKGALSGMMAVNRTFEHLTSTAAAAPPASPVGAAGTLQPIAKQDFTVQKVVHCLSQGLLLGLGLYKCHSMGLLPTHESDWLAFSQQPIPTEVSDISLNGWWHRQ